MRVKFWGVRGTIPAPGPQTNRYGGNTSCVSLRTEAGALFIIDMGTGVVGLGDDLMKTEFGKGEGKATVFLSHCHWDHIQGLPFFPPFFIPGNSFTVYGNAESPSMLEKILEGQMNPHFSPIYTLRNLGAELQFKGIADGTPVEVEGVTVRALPNPHGIRSNGMVGTALAIRFEEAGRSFVYASDAGYPETGPSDAMLEVYRGADVLVHDCTYTPEEQETRRERGFSSYADAAAAAVAAEVKCLVMFHYDQDYTDTQVDAIRDSCRAELDRLGGRDIRLTAASEGLEIEL